MSVSGMVSLQPRGDTSLEGETVNSNSLEVPLHLPQTHTSQTGQIKNKKPAKPYAIAGFCTSRTGMDRYLVPGTGARIPSCGTIYSLNNQGITET